MRFPTATPERPVGKAANGSPLGTKTRQANKTENKTGLFKGPYRPTTRLIWVAGKSLGKGRFVAWAGELRGVKTGSKKGGRFFPCIRQQALAKKEV